jgi:hypothetical protein
MSRERFVYIGPNIPSLGLKRNTIYQEKALPEGLAQIAKLKPVVQALYVNADGLAIAMRNLNKTGSLEQVASNTMQDMAKALNQQQRKDNDYGSLNL